MSARAHAIVIGAGLGGLAAAIGLQRAGYRVSVFEKAEQLAPAGFGIGITSNGLQALQQLGAHEPVLRAGCAVESSVIKNRRGEAIASAPVKTVGERIGVLSRSFHRAELQRALLEQLPPECLRAGRTCSGATEHAGQVQASFDDGARVDGDILIGADGINSIVRRTLHGEDEARFAGYVVWLAIMELRHPALHAGYNAHYWGAGTRFGLHDVGGGQWYWWGTRNTARVPARLRALQRVSCAEDPTYKPELVNTFRDFCPEVRHAIEVTPEQRIFLLNTRDRDPLRSWGKGRITLLGDAAHPMLTSLGQGASAAFEDAAVLVHCLLAEREPSAALARYEQLRIAKANRTVLATRRMSAIEQLEHPLAVWLRNALFKRMPQGLVARQLEQLTSFEMPEIATGGRPHAAAAARPTS